MRSEMPLPKSLAALAVTTFASLIFIVWELGWNTVLPYSILCVFTAIILVIICQLSPELRVASAAEFFQFLAAATIIFGVVLIVGTAAEILRKNIVIALQFGVRSTYTPIMVTVVMVTAAGIVLFFLRERYRATYGFLESASGLMVSAYQVWLWASSGKPASVGLFLVLLTAGVYLFVRGLDNIKTGLTKQPMDAFAINLLSKLQRR